jgi:hypothetical protein
MNAKLLKKASYEDEIAALEVQTDLEPLDTGHVWERVVWRHEPTIKPNRLDQVGLAENSNEFPALRALHVGDPDFWFSKLVNDYDRKPRAWVIEIYPVEGDMLADDPQYNIPDVDGNKATSKVLITRRSVLKEGEDFDFVRELGEDDLEDHGGLDYGFDDEDEEVDDYSYSSDYGNEDE